MDMLELPHFKDAEIGVCSTWNGDQLVERIVYDAHKMASILMADKGIAVDEALEYIEQEFILKYAGDTQPIVVWRVSEDDDQ